MICVREEFVYDTLGYLSTKYLIYKVVVI